MPRPLRIQVDGCLYLLTTRGVSQEPIFKDEQDYAAYRRLLAEYRGRYRFVLYAYCLLPDQVQLCLEPAPGTSVSSIMHDLSAAYTRYANRRYNRSGHLFQARYKSVIAEKSSELLALTAWMHRSPAHAGLCSDAAKYPFSSYAWYLAGGLAEDGLKTDEAVGDVLRAAPEPTASAYVRFVESLSAAELARLSARLQQPVVGSDDFVQTVKQRLARTASMSSANALTSDDPTQPAPIRRRVRPSVLAGSLATLVVGLGLGVILLSHRVMSLEQTVFALAQENDVAFRTQYSVSMRTAAQLASLDGTQWEIRLTAVQGQAVAAAQDELAFKEHRVASTALESEGFARSNYKTLLQPSGRLIWESMQANEQGDVISWRGERQGPQMRGIMTKQMLGKAAENYTFVGVARPATERQRSEI